MCLLLGYWVIMHFSLGKTSLPAGGSGYKSLLVARGEADAYVHVTKIKVLLERKQHSTFSLPHVLLGEGRCGMCVRVRL